MNEPRAPRPLAALIGAHYGRPALVMGGGDSLPEQAARAPADCVFISANQHGCILRACDYIVSCDEWGARKFKMPDGTDRGLRDFGIPIISVRRADADVLIFEKLTASSGATAAWAAWIMGCAPILLGGMDCYVGGTYFHDGKAASSGKKIPLSGHLSRWSMVVKAAPDGMFRSLGGPLRKLFALYDPDEPVLLPARRDAIPGTRGTLARVTKRWKLPPAEFAPGAKIELSHAELTRGIRERAVEKAA